jgi:Mn-containing catalase
MNRISEGTSESASKLLELAKGRFGELNEAEEKLFRSFADGEPTVKWHRTLRIDAATERH